MCVLVRACRVVITIVPNMSTSRTTAGARAHDPDASARATEAAAEAPPLTLDALDADALREIYAHLKVPLALKLACRALRDAGPPKTESYEEHAHETLAQLRWALRMGLRLSRPLVERAAARGELDQLRFIEGVEWANGFDFWHANVTGPAAQHGQVHVLEHFMPGELKPYDYPPVFGWAAYGGQRPTLEWLIARFPNVKIDFGVLTAAARGGQLDVLKWLHYEKGVEWQKDAARQAAKNGHAHVLEWLRYGARWPLSITPADDPWAHAETFTDAAKAGQLDVLKWAHHNTGVVSSPESWPLAASVGGHVHVLRWMATLHGANSHYFDPAIYQAVNRNQIDVLKWAHEEAGFVARERHTYYDHARRVGSHKAAEWLLATFPDLAQREW